jgi:hypothetical protein
VNEPTRLFAAHIVNHHEPQVPFWFMNEPQLNLCCTFSGICNTRRFELNGCFINFGFMIDDRKLMIEKPYQKSEFIDRKSSMSAEAIS